jgi:hypothetical protein
MNPEDLEKCGAQTPILQEKWVFRNNKRTEGYLVAMRRFWSLWKSVMRKELTFILSRQIKAIILQGD